MKNFDLLPYENKFQSYTKDFLRKKNEHDYIENIKLKIYHSQQVYKHALNISISENNSKENTFIAGVCGLFHDIGRFIQFYKYNTFKDSQNLYHGQLGCEVIEKENFFSDIAPEIISVIKAAVYAHGLLKIPENYSKKEKYFSKITRDADKTDIFRIIVKYYNTTGPRNISLEYGLEDFPKVSNDVLSCFLNKQLISKNSLKTLNDFKLMQIAWIYDINFDYTRNHILENGYLEKIAMSITDGLAQTKILEHLEQIKKSPVSETLCHK